MGHVAPEADWRDGFDRKGIEGVVLGDLLDGLATLVESLNLLGGHGDGMEARIGGGGATRVACLAEPRQIDRQHANPAGRATAVDEKEAVACLVDRAGGGLAMEALGRADGTEAFRRLALAVVPAHEIVGQRVDAMVVARLLKLINGDGVPEDALLIDGKLVDTHCRGHFGDKLVEGGFTADGGDGQRARIEGKELIGAEGREDEGVVVDVLRVRHVAVPGVIAVIAGILGYAPVKIFNPLGVDVHPPEVARLGAAVDMLVGSDMQAVAEDFGHLAEVADLMRIEREAIEMAAHEADHVDGVVLGVVGGAVDRFPRHGDAPVLGLAGFGVVANHGRAWPPFPEMGVVSERHPLGLVRCTISGVGGAKEAPVGKDRQRLMQFGNGKLPRRW